MANPAEAALVISPWLEGWFLPALLAEAGLHCDLVSACPSFRLSRHIHHLEVVEAAGALAPRALQLWQQHGPYRWVIAMSDSLLGELAQRALLDPRYRHLLPLTPNASTAHLHSKIGLSRAFSAAGIPTPAWRVASDPATALQQAPALGWPLLLKQDGSAGGRGVWRCETPAELGEAAANQTGKPFLLQQWRSGSLYSVEALFRQAQLQAFACSEGLAFSGQHGPSTHRRYGLPAGQIPELDNQLERIGSTLGLHGFANISLIHGGAAEPPLFFECDVRPNAWIHLDRALGGDFARALRAAQPTTGRRACYPQLQPQILAPFRPPPTSGNAAEAWPYPPPNDAPAFLEAVLASGQLQRTTSAPEAV